LHRQIGCQFQGKRKITFGARDQEVGHDRNNTWTLRGVAAGFRVAVGALEKITAAWIGSNWMMELTASGTRGTPPQKPCCNWCATAGVTASQKPGGYGGWHWIRDTQLHEVGHHVRGNGAGVMATLSTAALNLLRLAGFCSIQAGIQALMHNITALLAIARRRLKPDSD
jgi:hypothetical protein